MLDKQPMISTLQALLVALVAVLPGATYTIARESRGATWAWRQTDAATLIFRFLAASAVFHALLAPITYHAYEHLIVTHRLAKGEAVSWWWWPVVLAYVAVPYLIGALTERARYWQDSASCTKRAVSWFVALYAGRSPEPRAWDHFFSRRPAGIVRMRLMDDDSTWKAGLWSTKSFASQYGEDGDLYLEEEYVVGPAGELVENGEGYESAGVGLLIRWSEVRYLEFAEWSTETDAADGDGSSDA